MQEMAPTLVEQEVAEGFRLAPQQERLWLMQEATGRANYRAECVLRFEGALRVDALEAAIRSVIARHEILRTTFRHLPGLTSPVQVISEDYRAELVARDLSALAAAAQQTELAALLAEAARAFDLTRTPLRRVTLARLAPRSHALLLSLPALYADRTGLENLAREIARAYDAATRDAEVVDEPLQYADLAEWQNDLLEAEETEEGRRFWQQQGFSAAGLLKLPSEQETGASAPSFVPQKLTARLDAETTARLRELAADVGTSAQTLLLACWQVLLWRLTGQADIVTGVAYDCRTHEGVSDALGLFARLLPIGARLEHDLTLAELAARTATAEREAAKWQDYFAWPSPALGETGTSAVGPDFFSFCFEWCADAPRLAAGGVNLWPASVEVCTERFKVKLLCRQIDGAVDGDEISAGKLIEGALSTDEATSSALVIELHFDASYYEATESERLLARYLHLLQSAVGGAGVVLAALEILPACERQQVLYDFNATRVEFGRATTVPGLFEGQAARTPAAVAVVAEDGALTYAELNARADRLARHLRRLGVGPDVLVGVLLERSLELLVGLLGVLKAGGAYVPLDPQYPAERLAFMLADAGAPVLVTTRALLSRRPPSSATVVCLDETAEWAADVTGLSAENPTGGAQPDNLAYVIYTSGSTGVPKGVTVTHAAICNRLLWMHHAYPLTPSDRVLQKTAVSFDASIWELFVPLLCGAQVVLARAGGQHDAAYLCQAVQVYGVTTLQLVPTMLAVVLAEAGFAQCRSLRRVWCGGEVVTPELVRRFFANSPHPDIELHNLYGPTETAIDATHWLCARADSASARVPIGRPLANLHAYVLDARMQPVPIGVAGELYVGGVQLARGYLHRPDLTAEKFVPDPYSPDGGARLYRTGDVARWTGAGVLEYMGRADAQVKLRGFRIELGEVEARLKTHPAVRAAVVLLREDRPGDQRLVAYVVAERGAAPIAEALRHFAGEKLPDFMLPSAFVFLEALPITPNGKLDRRALPPPAADGASAAQTYVAPRDEVERALVQLWEEILDVRPVGVTDDFFLLGGHSVLALRVVGQIHKLFGQEVPLATMIQAGTIENLARMLRAEPRLLPWDPLVTIQPEGTKTPFFAIHSIGGQVFCYVSLARHLGPQQPFYGLQAPALQDVGDRHVAIEDMAAHYVKAMRDVQPAGPYMLGGYSFGVQVAFEMACQLKAQGQEVALLALLDSPSPIELHKLPPYEEDDAFMFALHGKVTAFERGRTIEMTRDEFDGLDYETQLANFHKRMVDEELFPPEHDIEFLRNFMVGYKTRQKAVRFYHPKPYPGRITLFRAAETDPWLVEHFIKAGVDMNDQTSGWGALSTEPVAVYEIPGNHDRMCYEPHVRVLAKRMRQCIDQALNGDAGSSAHGWAKKILRKG
jgi:amino acid adenylation domain-containing protein